MTPNQKTWIASRTTTQLIEGFNKLLAEGKAHQSEWLEWCKIWSEGKELLPEDTMKTAYQVFKESEE